MAERLEPRVLYSADALGPLAPLLLDDEDDASRASEDVAALLATTTPHAPDASGIGAGHVVFVDGVVADAESVAHALRESGARVVLVGAGEDGLAVVSGTLAAESGIGAVHLFAHGEDGVLRLGTATLDAAALDGRGAEIGRWGDALTADGDLLLYGCDVASGAAGRELVADLAAITGADVAASDDRSGHGSRGANWTLEVASGAIESAVLDDAALGGDWRHELGEFRVTETGDGLNAPSSIRTLADLRDWEEADPGNRATLRDALLVAARDGANDTIRLGAGTYVLDVGEAGEGDGEEGDLDIDHTVRIVGEGAGETTIRMAIDDRVFHLHDEAELTLENLDVTGGRLDEDGAKGGGIRVEDDASLELLGVTVHGNRAGVDPGSDGDGGGIHADDDASVRIADSSITGNRAHGKGGGIFAEDLTIANSVIADNVASDGQGGGMFVDGFLTARDVFVRGNTASTDGGGAHVHGGGVLERVTFADNTAGDAGGGLGHHQTEGVAMGLRDVTFSGNEAHRGGGLHVDGDISIAHATFVGNSATPNDRAVGVELETNRRERRRGGAGEHARRRRPGRRRCVRSSS